MATKKKIAKSVSKKTAPKKAALKAARPVKKAAPKKAPIKKVAAKPVLKKAAVKKAVAKPVAKKAPAKSSKPLPSKKITKSINKSTPVKKTVTPVVKKAARKTLSTPNKNYKPSVKPGIKPVVPPAKASNKIEIKQPAKAAVSKHLPKAKDIKVPAPKPVVMPKITTTKSRKYEPEFTKSVLDQAPQGNNGPTQRYSDGELTEFRELIQRKLETAKKELGYLQGLITRKDEMGGDDTDNRYMTMEDGSLSMEREQLSQMASRQITFIDHLEKAMMRIENKTYGICRVTGKLIDKARLRAVPHATLSIEAKMGQVR